jgi:hypothetical protein
MVVGRLEWWVAGPLFGQTSFLGDAGVLDGSLRKLRQACVSSFLGDAGVLDGSLRKLRSRPSSRWANSLAGHSASFMPRSAAAG